MFTRTHKIRYRITNQIQLVVLRQQFDVRATAFLAVLEFHLVPSQLANMPSSVLLLSDQGAY